MYSLTHSGYAFSGNPLRVQSSGLGGRNSFRLNVGGETIYTGRFSGNILDVDISKIIAPALPRAPWVNPGNGELCSIITEVNFDRWLVEVSTLNEEDDEEVLGSCYVLPGGIPNYLLRNLQNPVDIFGDRFLAPGNLFFTTRSSTPLITIPETELAPLCFLSKFPSSQLEMPITIRTKAGLELGTGTDTHGIWGLNIEGVRRYFFEEYEEIHSVFDVFIRNKYCATIVIEKAPAAKDRCRLRFRNSFGFFDIVDLYGGISTSYFNDESGENTYSVYDEIIGGYTSKRERLACPQSITVNSGIRRPNQMNVLLDAICSEEVYLLDLFEFPVRVIPSCESVNLPWRIRTPQSLNIKLTLADDEKFIMPGDIDFDGGRLFTNPFTNPFK